MMTNRYNLLMLRTFLLGIVHEKVWPSHSDHDEFSLDPGAYFLSWMGQRDECSYLTCYCTAISMPTEMEWGLRAHPALAVNKSNSYIVGCMVSASKCKCYFFFLPRRNDELLKSTQLDSFFPLQHIFSHNI